MFGYFVEDFERLVVRKYAEGCTPQITMEPLDAPDDPNCLKIERDPVALIVEGSTANVNNRANGAILLFLLEGSSETIDTCVAVEGENGESCQLPHPSQGRPGPLAPIIPRGVLAQSIVSVSDVKTNSTPCFRRKATGRIRSSMSRRNFL